MNVAEVLDLRRSGLGYRTIAKQLGISRDRVLNICHKNGLGGQIAEAPKVTEQQVAEYVSSCGFDYVGGFQTMKKPITVKCRQCNGLFDRQAHIFRDVVNGTWTFKNECPVCRHDKHLQYVANKEQEKTERQIEAEHEAQKREQQEVVRLSRNVNNELTRRLAIHVCRNCGIEFCQSVTGYNSELYCSQRCQSRWLNRTRSEKRYKRLMSRRHDTDISLERLFKRDGGICYLCGRMCEWDDGAERDGTFIAGDCYPSVDHVIPVSKGGTHTWDNIKLAHRSCNLAKRDS